MTTAQVVATSVTNNSLSQDYPHSDDHAKHSYSNVTLNAERELRTQILVHGMLRGWVVGLHTQRLYKERGYMIVQ